jgi:cystathionine beta-lyase/cystathionine gamma-synthase
MDQYGTVLAFELAGGRAEAARFLDQLELARCATSLGGPETLVCNPMTTTHASLSPDEQADLGVTDGLMRASVGLEDPIDVLADFEHALS